MKLLRLLWVIPAIVIGSAAWAASPPELLQQGEYIARAGDCIVCHTGEPSKPFAGGLKMGTPVGAIYTTNITPDKKTGIGNYSFADFDKAMRKGVAKDGRRLFPAMPYPSYANMSDADMKALYAFFMEGVPPVARDTEKNELRSPLDHQWIVNTGLAVWQVLFVHASPFQPDAAHDAAWNRGAYLVEGLEHCGSCHTPRGVFFQEKGMDASKAAFVSGAELDYWSAPNLRSDAGDGLGRWSEADLAAFLKSGHAPTASAFGTMIDVINNSTQYLADADLTAMAHYLKSLTPAGRPGQAPTYDATVAAKLVSYNAATPGERIYMQRCTGCHAADGKGRDTYVPALFGNPSVLDKNASSLINVVLNGSQRIVLGGQPDPYRMVQFRAVLNDEEVADVVSFIRSAWGNSADAVKADQVRDIRKYADPASDQVVVLKMK